MNQQRRDRILIPTPFPQPRPQADSVAFPAHASAHPTYYRRMCSMPFAPPAEQKLVASTPAKMIAHGYFRILNFFNIAEALYLEKLRSLPRPNAPPPSPASVHLSPEPPQPPPPPSH